MWNETRAVGQGKPDYWIAVVCETRDQDATVSQAKKRAEALLKDKLP
jgi:hypothetical protein